MLTAKVRELPVTSHMIKKAPASDPLLQEIISYYRTRWLTVSPNKQLLPFFQRTSSLSEVDGVLPFDERVIIPSSLQNRTLNKFHFGHRVVSCMKALARSYVYWPNTYKQLEDLAHTCAKCQPASKWPRESTLSLWPVPDSQWLRLHIDFAEPTNGQSFLVVVDAYSKWREIFPMSHTTSEETISKLQKVFSRFGLPETEVSDNGNAFSSVKFSTLCQQNGINHISTPPFHPQSNGPVERLVDTYKRALLKLRWEGTTSEILETFWQAIGRHQTLTHQTVAHLQNPWWIGKHGYTSTSYVQNNITPSGKTQKWKGSTIATIVLFKGNSYLDNNSWQKTTGTKQKHGLKDILYNKLEMSQCKCPKFHLGSTF